ncbi:protein of unknown function [Serratia sp. Tan611]|nr:protein of unknown function [Serratia sp. Tan611]
MIAVDVPITADVYFLRTVYTANAADAAFARILPAALAEKHGENYKVPCVSRYFDGFSQTKIYFAMCFATDDFMRRRRAEKRIYCMAPGRRNERTPFLRRRVFYSRDGHLRRRAGRNLPALAGGAPAQ